MNRPPVLNGERVLLDRDVAELYECAKQGPTFFVLQEICSGFKMNDNLLL